MKETDEESVSLQIRSALRQIERRKNVVVLYACESGSRAWGFASPDSDYDVRFIYKHDVDWYLSINVERKRDVIEIDEEPFDYAGWDLRKALALFRKSNPPLLEWLRSPIVYFERGNFSHHLTGLLPTYYSPRSCAYHYYHMARGNWRQYIDTDYDEVWVKKYLYVLRPILAVEWIEKYEGARLPPVLFSEMLGLLPGPGRGALMKEIDQLLQDKANGVEMHMGSRYEFIDEFLAERVAELDKKFDLPTGEKSAEPLNEFFRGVVLPETMFELSSPPREG